MTYLKCLQLSDGSLGAVDVAGFAQRLALSQQLRDAPREHVQILLHAHISWYPHTEECSLSMREAALAQGRGPQHDMELWCHICCDLQASLEPFTLGGRADVVRVAASQCLTY